MRRIGRLVSGLLSFYAVSFLLVPLVKKLIPRPAGTILSCFLQMFFVVFLFPLCLKLFEKPETA